MSDLSNPHDRFFKETFSRIEVARDLLANYLPPEVVAILDSTSPPTATRRFSRSKISRKDAKNAKVF